VKKGALAVTVASASGLGDTGALVQELRKLLAASDGCLRHAGGGELALKLTIDKSGKVVKVELVRGPAPALACLKARVMHLQTTTRASGASGTAEVVIGL
jgi:hypothetical protein